MRRATTDDLEVYGHFYVSYAYDDHVTTVIFTYGDGPFVWKSTIMRKRDL